METEILRLQEEFIPEKYGIPSIFDNISYRGNFFLYEHNFKPINEEYDCLSACLHLKKELKKQGIESKLCEGKDFLEIFKQHIFIELENSNILDPIPIYNFINPRHKKTEYIKEADIKKYESDKKYFGLLEIFPLSFESKNNNLSLLGINYLDKIGKTKLRILKPRLLYLLYDLNNSQVHRLDIDLFELQTNPGFLENKIQSFDENKDSKTIKQINKDKKHILKLANNCSKAMN